MTRLLTMILLAALLSVTVSAQPVTRLASSQVVGTMTTSGDVITFPIDPGIGYGSIGVEARGTWTGTVAIQCLASRSGGTYAAVILSPRSSSTSVTSFTANGQWSGSIVGCQAVRATATAAMTGTVTITMVGSFAGGGAGGGGGGGGAVTQGTDPWIVAGGGTAGSAATGVATIQGIAAMTPVLVEPATGSFNTDAEVDATPILDTGPLVLCQGNSSAPTSVTAGRAQYFWCDLSGRIQMNVSQVGGAAMSATNPLITTGFPGTLVSGAVTSAMTGTTSTSVVTGVGSNYLYITSCVVSNASLTVSTDILLQDGSGGTTLYVIPAPAAGVATTGGGGAAHSFGAPLKVPTSGNGLFAANVTTGSSTKISCNGFRSTVSY